MTAFPQRISPVTDELQRRQGKSLKHPGGPRSWTRAGVVRQYHIPPRLEVLTVTYFLPQNKQQQGCIPIPELTDAAKATEIIYKRKCETRMCEINELYTKVPRSTALDLSK